MFWTAIFLQKKCHSTCICKFQHLAPRIARLDLHLTKRFLKEEIRLFWLRFWFPLFYLKSIHFCLLPSFGSTRVPVGVWAEAWGSQGREKAHLCGHIPTLSHSHSHSLYTYTTAHPMPGSRIKAIFGYVLSSAHYFIAWSMHNVCLEVLEGTTLKGLM